MTQPPAPSVSKDNQDKRLRSLSRIYELTSELLHVEHMDVFLTSIVKSVSDIFGFDRVSISVLNEEEGIFTDHAFAGYSEEEKREILSNPTSFTREEILQDFREDCRISRITYYVPYEKQTSTVNGFVVIRDKQAAAKPRKSKDSWHELDLLYFALQNRMGELIGYLQVDYPKDLKIPPMETLQEIELFANIAAVGVENLNMFERAQDLLDENELRTSRMLELFELIRSVLRVDDLDVVLQKVSDALASTFGFRKTGVSIFAEGSNSVTVDAMTGYAPEEEDAVRRSNILKDKVLEDFKEEFRVTRTGFFIPGERQGDGSSFVFLENPSKAFAPRASVDSWHELDLLYFAMYDRDGKMLGYIQLDYPKDGKIPTKDTIESMEAFASIATIAVENSAMFTRVDEAKNQVRMYLDLLTHDVGNLVNPINAYLEVVMGTTQLTPVQYKYLSSAQESARSISHLIRNVRRSSQMLESATIELVPMNLTKSIKQTAAETRSAFLSKKVNIRLNLPEQDIWVMADNFIDEVMYNLLTNAVKYDEHEEIIVDVEYSLVEFEGRKYAQVKLTDRGIGIPDEFKDKVFTREFKKLVKSDRPILQRSRGAGMGLSLVRGLVERYGGKIWVENRVYDDYTRGSVFAFILAVP
jgi:signal transduction histidine kinase/uncharacterized protein YigA (DUF484 family)